MSTNQFEDDDVALISIGSTDSGDANSSYCKEPRKATDKYSTGIFFAVVLAFFIWGGIGIKGKKNSEFLLNFFEHPSDWVISADDHSVCCLLQPSDNGDNESCRPWVPDTELVGFEADTDDNSVEQCLDSISEGDISGDIASPICFAVLGSTLMGGLMLLGFRLVPQVMVYFVVFTKIGVPSALGLWLYSHNDDYDGVLIYPAYGCFLVAGILALIFFIYRNELKLCSKLFKVSSSAMTDNLVLLPIMAAVATVATLIKLGLLFYIVLNLFTMDILPATGAAYIDNDITDHIVCYPNFREHYYDFASFGFATAIPFFALVVLETRNYIVADVIGAWYWHGKKGASAMRAIKNAFCSHFGTICFAAIVMWFVEKLKKKAKYKGINPYLCILKCIALCILSYIEYLCKMSVIVTAITGNHLIGSGHKVVKLFTSSFGNMKASTGVWWIPPMIIRSFVNILSFMTGLASGFIMYGAVSNQGSGHCKGTYVPIIAGAVIGILVLLLCLFLLSFFGSILLTTVDTVYMCFIMDREKGVVTHPELHSIFDEVLSKRKDVSLIVVQAQGSVNVNVTVTAQPQLVMSSASQPPAYGHKPISPNTAFQTPQVQMQQGAAPHVQAAPQPFWPGSSAPMQHQPPVAPIQQQGSYAPMQQQASYAPMQQQASPAPMQPLSSQQLTPDSQIKPNLADQQTRFCTACGQSNSSASKFCAACGQLLN